MDYRAAANPAAICVACGWSTFKPYDDRDIRGQHIDAAHERVRALEAELAEWKKVFPNEDYIRSLEARAEKAESRVEELEARIRRSDHIRLSHYPDGSCYYGVCPLKAREKEA